MVVRTATSFVCGELPPDHSRGYAAPKACCLLFVAPMRQTWCPPSVRPCRRWMAQDDQSLSLWLRRDLPGHATSSEGGESAVRGLPGSVVACVDNRRPCAHRGYVTCDARHRRGARSWPRSCAEPVCRGAWWTSKGRWVARARRHRVDIGRGRAADERRAAGLAHCLRVCTAAQKGGVRVEGGRAEGDEIDIVIIGCVCRVEVRIHGAACRQR